MKKLLRLLISSTLVTASPAPSAHLLLARGGLALGAGVGVLLASLSAKAESSKPRVLKFSGVPMSLAGGLKKRFPFVFEREVTLAEVDEIVRYLMATGSFSNIEVLDRQVSEGSRERELILTASILRKIQSVSISGSKRLSSFEVERLLNIKEGQTFERKNLLAAADELRRAYEKVGYHNSKVEIDFDLPNDNEVRIGVAIDEGVPLRINDVTIDSLNPEIVRRVGRLANRIKGRVLTEDELMDFQKRAGDMLVDNRFLTSRLLAPQITYNADRTQAKIAYTVENPYKFEFRIQGNLFFSDNRIIRQIESEKLTGATASPAPDMAERIRRLYQSAGYANVEVDFNEQTFGADWIQKISFTIKENPRVRVKRIEISGNVSRPAAYYAQFIRASISDLIGSGYYNRKDIEDGGKQLVTELQNQGYLRAKLQSQRAEYSKDKTTVTIYLNVDEGPLTQVRQIRFDGVDAFPKAQLLEVIKIKAGAALSLKDLEESIQILKEFYRSEGFLEMKIVNETERNKIVTYNDSNTQATITFQINEGPRVRVGSIVLQGNSFTKDYVIRRELMFSTGDVLTPEKLDESIFRLQRLGLFGRVQVKTLEEGSSIAERTVIVDITERDPGLFTMGIGADNADNQEKITFRGYLGVSYRNLMGTGRGISFRADPRFATDPRINYLEHRIATSYLEPYIFGGSNRGRVNLVRDVRWDNISPNERGQEVTTILEENSFSLLFERDLTRHIKLTFTGYGFANFRRFERQTERTVQTQNVAKIGPLIEFDYRDDIFSPTRGSYSFLNFEYSDPVLGSSRDEFQTINFVKANASFTAYQPLFKRKDLVWANSVRSGYLANVSNAPNAKIPSQEAFFLGGRTTVRGFERGADPNRDERFPNRFDLFSDGDANLNQFFVTSDSYFYLLKTELRFPISKNMPVIGELGGAIFYDGGAVYLSQPDVNLPFPYRDAIGLALRIPTPVGPLNAEVGCKLRRRTFRTTTGERKESPCVFTFSVGAF